MGELVTGIVGIAGVLFGLFAERLLQRYGKVRCEMAPLELSVFSPKEASTITLHSLPIPPDLLPDAEAARDLAGFGEGAARYFVSAKLFNEKETKTGLRDVVIAFDGKPPFERTMMDRTTWRGSTAAKPMDALEVVNLPSREWVTLSLMDDLRLEDARKLTECNRAWLRGYFPDGRRFSQRVPFAADRPEQA